MELAAVFLDLGNTLLTERFSRAALYAQEGVRAGLAIDEVGMSTCMAHAHGALPREIEGSFRYSDGWFRAFQRRIFVDQLGLDAVHFEELSERLFARFEDPASFVLYPGARELLAALRTRGLPVGLISNWSERLPRLLETLGLTPAFDFVLGSAALRMEKPERGIFERALRLVSKPPEACLHAGDDLLCDARGALEVGIQAVLVDHRGRLGPAERALCPIVSNLTELRDLILERAA